MCVHSLTHACIFVCRFDKEQGQDEQNHLDCFSVIASGIEVTHLFSSIQICFNNLIIMKWISDWYY